MYRPGDRSTLQCDTDTTYTNIQFVQDMSLVCVGPAAGLITSNIETRCLLFDYNFTVTISADQMSTYIRPLFKQYLLSVNRMSIIDISTFSLQSQLLLLAMQINISIEVAEKVGLLL